MSAAYRLSEESSGMRRPFIVCFVGPQQSSAAVETCLWAEVRSKTG